MVILVSRNAQLFLALRIKLCLDVTQFLRYYKRKGDEEPPEE